METEMGKKVKIRFKCSRQDGKVYRVGDRDTLDFVVGAGVIPPALEKGILGMKPGEHRKIRVPADEVDKFPFPRGWHFEGTVTPPGIAYQFGPGDGGDVSELIPAGTGKHSREPLPRGAGIFFDIDMLAVENHFIK